MLAWQTLLLQFYIWRSQIARKSKISERGSGDRAGALEISERGAGALEISERGSGDFIARKSKISRN